MSSHMGIYYTRIIILLYWAFLLVLHWPVTNGDDEDVNDVLQDDTKLPSLWTAATSGTYHISYQLELPGSIQLVEEWASFHDHKFRLDLIGADGAKMTFLVDGHTHETFCYKPFECSRLDGGKMFYDWNPIAPLFVGHAWDDDMESKNAYRAYGLGPLWLSAYEEAQRVERVTVNDLEGAPFEALYKMYDVEIRPELVPTREPYRLRFYFNKNIHSGFVDMVDWYLNENKEHYHVRALVIQKDYTNLVDDYVFKLPVGYGCSRRRDLDPSLQIDIGQVLFHQRSPNQASLEVITSTPDDESLQAASWTNRKYGLRVLRVVGPQIYDSKKIEGYYVTLAQFRESSVDKKTEADGLKLGIDTDLKHKRIKQVWWAPDIDHGQATVYTIDQSTGKCVIDHQDVHNQVLVTFGSDSSSVAFESMQVALSLDQIAELFDEFSSYSLVDEGIILDQNKFQNRYYEKRVQNFTLKSPDRSVAWSGPVSIVKQVSILSSYSNQQTAQTGSKSGSGGSLLLASDYRIKVIIFFYSDALDRLLFKLVLDLLDNHNVSFSYAQQLMDVSVCFLPEQKQDIVLKYPLPSMDLSEQLENKQESIKLVAGGRLFKFLMPLQIYDIRPSFDPFYMHLQMSILDLPLTHTFQMERGLSLEPKHTLNEYEASRSVHKLVASNAEICGEHCEYYNCFSFSYDMLSRSCHLALNPTKAETKDCATCELYTYYERRSRANGQLGDQYENVPPELEPLFYRSENERPHLGSSSIIELFEKLVETAQTSRALGASSLNPIVLYVSLKPDTDLLSQPSFLKDDSVVVLKPSAVEHNLETMNEYVRESGLINDESDPLKGTQILVRVRGDKQLRLEYSILFEDSTFVKYVDESLKGVTYEECAQHCERNDCRSFAYCLHDETCQTSSQHAEKYLRTFTIATNSSRKCNIYRLEYLSKFEPFGRVLPPNANKVAGNEVVAGPDDCAAACMDRKDFKCQGFYFCRQSKNQHMPGEDLWCLMTTKSAAVMEVDERKISLRPLITSASGNDVNGETDAPTSSLSDDTRECFFYSRSYLSHFDKYLGKKINIGRALSTFTVLGSLQDCARSCLNANCLGFDACAVALDSKKPRYGSQKCQLALESIKRHQVLPDKKCTTFVLSDKSHFNLRKLKVIHDSAAADDESKQMLGKPDKEADIDEDSMEDGGKTDLLADIGDEEQGIGTKLKMLVEYGRSRWHHNQHLAGHTWLAKLLSLSLGIVLGVGFILGWNQVYSRGWLSRLSQMARERSF